MAANSPEGGAGMTPEDIGRKTFTMVRKGFDPIEVQGFLMAVSTELREARSQALTLDRELQAARHEAERSRDLGPKQLTALLGEETARVLDAARSAADEMRAKAEQSTTRLVSETIASTDELKSKTEATSAQLLADAEAESARMRAEATSESEQMREEAAELLERRTAEAQAEAERLLAEAQADAAAALERGRQDGREMVAEAQRVRERMLNDLARRRKAFRQQIERLQAGRDRLMSAYDVVRETLDVATEELTVAMPQARLAAEAAALRAADENAPSLEELEREAAELPDVEPSAGSDPGLPDPGAPSGETDAETGDGGATAVVEAVVVEADVAPTEPPSDGSAVVEPEADPGPDGPLAPSDASVEGRRSSSVKVIRSDEPTEAEAGPEGVAAADAQDDADAGAAGPPESESNVAEAVPAAEVSSLFARIREETTTVDTPEGEVEVTVDEIEIVEEIVVDESELAELQALGATQLDAAQADAQAGDQADGEAGDQAEPVEELDPDHLLLARRDEALVEIERNLGRRIKRELSDEQNELLDTVRRQKGVPAADAALPDSAAHAARYRTAALPSLVAAPTAGADLLTDSGITLAPAGKSGAKAGDLAGELATDLIEPLRQRLDRCFAETADDPDELAERLRACYREWKGQRVDELVSRQSLAAANRGLVDRLPEGTLVHWVVDDGSTPSPDCDDNALAGDIPRGDPFPTGHTVPPLSNHCRCLVAPKRG